MQLVPKIFRHKIIGHVDEIGIGGVEGWAMSRPGRGLTAVELFIDGELAGEAIASRYRADIKRIYGGNGKHGFRVQIPAKWLDGDEHKIAVRIRAIGKNASQDLITPAAVRLGIARADPAGFAETANNLLREATWIETQHRREADRIALLAFHSEDGNITASQLNILSSLNASGFRIICCHSSNKISDEFIQKLKLYCSDILIRADFGRDFASWCLLIDNFRNCIEKCKRLFLINDSFYFFSDQISQTISEIDKGDYDVYAITDSTQKSYHLQSSFLAFKESAIANKYFWNFVYSYPFPKQKSDIIFCGEIALSTMLIEGGLRLGSMLSISSRETPTRGTRGTFNNFFTGKRKKSIDSQKYSDYIEFNPQHVLWREIIELGIPIIKRELLLYNPANVANLSEVYDVIKARYGPAAVEQVKAEIANARATAAQTQAELPTVTDK